MLTQNLTSKTKKHITTSVLITTLAITTLSSCTFHKINKDVQPNIKIPSQFSEQTTTETLTTPWWHTLQRPTLNNIIDTAFKNNLSLAQALSRVRQAESFITETQSDRLPQLNTKATKTQPWQGSNQQRTTNEVGAKLSWELDLFNRIGTQTNAKKYEAQARIEDTNALRLILSTEIANAYFGAVAAQKRLALLNEQVHIDQELLKLLILRNETGVGTNVEVLQQKSRVADSLSLIPSTKTTLQIFENRLDVLVGTTPDGKTRTTSEENLDVTTNLPEIGIPANLLINRPDLRTAKAQLIAADNEIAAAIAERLPSINLTGTFTHSETVNYSGPLSVLTTSFVEPLLDWGKRKAAVKRNREIYQEKLAAFTETFLKAVEEVENALTMEKNQREFLNRLEERRQILTQTFKQTEARFTQGVDDYLAALNALQELREVERDLIDEQRTLINARIALHRAIGSPITHTKSPSKK